MIFHHTHHHHHHVEARCEVNSRLDALAEKTDLILNRTETIMATLDELNALLVTIGDEVGKVSADTDNLLAQLQAIPPGGLTPAQQQAIDTAVASAQTIATRLQALDDKVPDATPAPIPAP